MSQPTPRTPRLLVLAAALAGVAIVIYLIARPKPALETTTAPRPPAGATATGTPPSSPAAPCSSPIPTHCPGGPCDACTAENCNPSRDGCDGLADEASRKLCEDAYACFVNPANKCLYKGNQGDAIPCWCGKNMTTCVSSNEPPTQANGPCVKEVFAAGASTDAATIRHRLVDPAYPLGRAINLSTCRGTFCAKECGVP